MTLSRHCIALSIALVVTACSRLIEVDGEPFVFDPTAPYRLRFGWGSAMHGLETFGLEPDGRLQVVRRTQSGWEAASLQLSDVQRAAVTAAIQRCDVSDMKRLYRDPDIHDGEQWVVCLEQGSGRRLVHCDNHFPLEGREFLGRLKVVAAFDGASWVRLSDSAGREHAAAMWALVR